MVRLDVFRKFLRLFGHVGCLRENAYLSRTIEVQENHKVVDTGLYGVMNLKNFSKKFCDY